MRCQHCAHDNPEGNRFCGACGNLLPAPRTSPSAQPSTPDYFQAPISTADESPASHPLAAGNRSAAPGSGISGPSFLGLNNAPAQTGYEYLLEDEPKSSSLAVIISLVLVMAAAIGVVTQWSSLKQWAVDLTARTQSQMAPAAQPSPEKPASTPPAPQAPAAGSPSSTPADTKPSEGAATAAAPSPTDDAADKSSSDSKSQPPVSSRAAGGKKQQETAKTSDEEDSSAERPPRSAPDDRHDPLLLSGERYLYGRGGRRNCAQALVNFQAAADRGNARALSHLGAMYATGNCVPLDRGRAYSFFSRALELDRSNSSLEHNLSMLWREMSPQERDRITRANR